MGDLHYSGTAAKPVAIVGIAAELPSGQYADSNLDHSAFFHFLLNKGESYETIPPERFNIESWHGNALGQVRAARGSFLKDIALFDYLEFGVSGKDARAMAVSTRKLLELSFLALLDAGIDYRARNIGCYTAGVAHDITTVADPDEFEARGSFAGAPCMLANKVSYHLDLRGPSVPLDTACSSTLTALHLAVQALRAGDCEAAVVGGCQLNLRVVDFVQYSQGAILAPDGKCKPFDAAADGFGRGEGAVAVVVKLLEDAVRDGDHIYASILGTGISMTGSEAPVGAPVASAQADAMRRAYRGTGRMPSEVDFIELHATGTAAGDPAECNWVGKHFQRGDELLVGSVKGNIGHLEISSFLVSLSKVCSILEAGIVPPNVNFNNPNPAIKWKEYRLRVATEATPLKPRSPSGKALISMTSSGIGGANGHVVLEGPPVDAAGHPALDSTRAGEPVLLVVGGLSPQSAKSIAESVATLGRSGKYELAELSAVYGRRARQMTWRAFAVPLPGQADPVLFAQPVLAPRVKPPVVFVFSGQGPQHINMGRQLFKAYPVFRASILEMDQVYRSAKGHSLIHSTGLFDNVDDAPDTPPDTWPIALILPSLAIIQMALFDLLRSVGVRPDIVVGHSAGETAVLYASGAAPRALAVELAIARGEAMTVMEGVGGAMAALSCGPADARRIIDDATCGKSGVLEIACFNAQEAVAIAGLEVYVDRAVELAQARGIVSRKIRTRVPVHSSVMEHCHERYQELTRAVFARYPGYHRPAVTTYSTLTGAVFTDLFTPAYFWENARRPVMFSKAISAILAESPAASFVEISPHPVLSSYVTTLGAAEASVTCPMRRARAPEEHDEARAFLASLGRFAVMGHNAVDFLALNGRCAVNAQLDLPPYPFAKKHVPYYPEFSPAIARQMRGRNGALNYPELRLNAMTHPDLAEHVINGEPIMPAAGFLEMALEFGARVLWKVAFRTIMSLSGDRPLPVEIDVDDAYWSVKSRILSSDFNNVSRTTKANRLHADGYLSRTPLVQHFPALDIAGILSRCQLFPLKGFYESMRYFAEFGPAFQRLVECYHNDDEILLKVRGANATLFAAERYVIHPAILDACIHAMVHPAFTANPNPNVYYLPSRVDLVIVHDAMIERDPAATLFSHITFRKWMPDEIVVDVVIANEDGERLCTMHGLSAAMYRISSVTGVSTRFDLVYQPFGNRTLRECPVDVMEDHKTSDLGQLYDVLDRTLPEQTFTASEFTKTNADQVQDNSMVALQSRWPAYSAITESLTQDTSNTLLDLSDLLNAFAPAITHCANVFHRVLSHIGQSGGKKVVRVLEVGAGRGCLVGKLVSVIDSFQDLDVEYTVSDESLEAALRVCPASGRAIAFRPSEPLNDQELSIASYDIVIGFHVLTPLPSFSTALESLNRLLLPGGTLILGEFDEAALASDAPGGRWLRSALDSFGYWSSSNHTSVKCQAMWKVALRCKGSEVIRMHRVQDQDPFFITLEAQRPPLQNVSTEHGVHSTETPLIVPFVLGREMDIQGTLAVLDDTESHAIWITAGKSEDGDAASGFSRSLRREFPSWTIRLVVFNKIWKECQYANIIQNLSQVESLESEIFIDSRGEVFVPRLVASQPPSEQTFFDSSAFWTLSETGTCQVVSPTIPPAHVLVRIETMSTPDDGLGGIVGHIADPGQTSIPTGTRILSIVRQPPSSFAVVHEGALTILLANESSATLASLSMALAVGPLALGLESFRQLSRMESRQILVTHSDTPVGEALVWLYTSLGLRPHAVSESTSALELSSIQLQTGDVVVSGYNTHAAILSGHIPPGARLFSWNNRDNGIPHLLSSDPWAIGDALRASLTAIALAKMEQLSFEGTLSRRPESYLSVSPIKTGNRSLFDPRKSYLIIGGIGSLGIHVSLWMYQQGARRIILTSRSGRASLVRAQDILALRILGYLESLPDLSLQLKASDASSKEAMELLIKDIHPPVSGCLMMSVRLSDKSFLSQTAESFSTVFAPKTQAFEALEASVPIETLDFLITFSSASIFGNAGQTNYSSANTVVDGKVGKYRNSFSLVAPGIIDTISISGRPGNNVQSSRVQHFVPWAMSSSQLCACIEDGIRKLADGPFNLYVPDLNWNLVKKYIGPSSLYGHLAKDSKPVIGGASENSRVSLQDLVLQYVDVPPDDFDAAVPLTSYGLDSLSATGLSFTLRPHVSITQFQLLADISLNDIQKLAEQSQAQGYQAEDGHRTVFDWRELNLPGHTVVKLVDCDGVPLILVHGASGNILSFAPLQEHFDTPLWAIQMTPETPTESLSAITGFYYQQIKAVRPTGPYRLGGFSGSSLITFALAHLFEANGDEVVQLAMIDHFPLFFLSSLLELDELTIQDQAASHILVEKVVAMLVGLCERDSGPAQRMGQEFVDAYKGMPVRDSVGEQYSAYLKITDINAGFLLTLGVCEGSHNRDILKTRMVEWLRRVRASVTVYVASKGMAATLPLAEREEWKDLGVKAVFSDSTVITVQAGHFDMFTMDALSESLQSGWSQV